MNYIWDIVLRARSEGTPEGDLHFRPAGECSPWYEQSFSVLNETHLPGPEVEYNPLYRFDRVFHSLLTAEISPELKNALFDAVSHLLVQLDLHHGLTRRDYYIRRLRLELEQGVFGRRAAAAALELPEEERSAVSALLVTQFQAGSSLQLFQNALRCLFPEAILYRLRRRGKKLLLYLWQDPAPVLERRVQLLERLFLPVGFHLRIFWGRHFGVFGVEATMKADQIQLY